MLQSLSQQPPDKILMLSQMLKADPRSEKVDLGVGVYRNAEGVTPVMQAVKTAERQLWETEATKSYTALVGDDGFRDAMAALVLGEDRDTDRIASAATPGGTGAVRQGLELIRMASPEGRIWVSDPTWPNHLSILKYLEMPLETYRYFDAETRAVDFGAMMADLDQVKPGDTVLLHGCCHNPTGANLTLAEWGEVTELLADKGATPLIDIAYQGFGDGLTEDAAGLRHMASALPETLIAASCSKNFGIYRERTGILMALAPNAEARPTVQSNMAFLNRQNFSFPPDHGARLVTMILTDPELRTAWETELEEVRLGMLRLRETLAEALRTRTGSDRFGFLAAHRGMFSRLGATPEQVDRLRNEHAIYMVGDSRINIAGLTEASIPRLADAILAVGI